MVEITINENLTRISTNDLNVLIEGDFEIKKKGAEAPVVNVIATNQQEFER